MTKGRQVSHRKYCKWWLWSHFIGTHALLPGQEPACFSNLGYDLIPDEQTASHRLGLSPANGVTLKLKSPIYMLLCKIRRPVQRLERTMAAFSVFIVPFRWLSQRPIRVITNPGRLYLLIQCKICLRFQQRQIALPLHEERNLGMSAAPGALPSQCMICPWWKSSNPDSFRLGLVHGRMKSQDKGSIMQEAFGGDGGKIQLLDCS